MYIATLENGKIPTVKVTSPDFEWTVLEVKLYADKAVIITPDTEYGVAYSKETSEEKLGRLNAQGINNVTLSEMNTTETFIRNMAKAKGLVDDIDTKSKEKGEPQDKMAYLRKQIGKIAEKRGLDPNKYFKKDREVSIQ